MVGRLVEHQQVHPARLQQRQRRPGALARRQRRRRPEHVVGAQPELGQQGAHVGRRPVGHRGAERVEQRLGAEEQPARLVDLADHARRARARPCPRRAGAGRAARPAAWTCPTPFGPVIATRSRPVDLQVDRAERERARAARRRRAASPRPRPTRGAAAIVHPQLPLLARLLDHLEPLDQPLGLPGLRGLLLARLGAERCGRSCRCRWPCAGRCARPSPSTPAASGPAPPGRPCVSAYSSYASRACRRATSRSSR